MRGILRGPNSCRLRPRGTLGVMHRADSHDLPPPPFALDQGRVALALAVIVMAIFLVLAGLPHSMPPRPLRLLPETIAAYGFIDSSRQLQAHRIVVALLAASTLFAGW